MGGNHQHVRLLINVGSANFNVVDGDGRTPLNYAVLNYSTKCIRVRDGRLERVTFCVVMSFIRGFVGVLRIGGELSRPEGSHGTSLRLRRGQR